MQQTVKKMITHGRNLWRFRWYAIAVAWIIVLIGWVTVSRIPDVYTASTQLYVDTATILKPLLKGLVIEQDNLDQQVGLMTNLLVSRPNLERVVRMVGDDDYSRLPDQLDNRLNQLKRKISVMGEKTNPKLTYLDLYTISYTDSNPELAKQTVQALINTFIETMMQKSRQDKKMANQFLEQQIEEYEARLTAAENRVREFKRQYIDVLPEQSQDYFTRLQAAQATADDIGLQIREAESQHNQLLQQLANTTANQRAVSSQGTPILTPTESRLAKLQERLDELLLNYTETHPDVVATRRIIVELEKQQETELKELASDPTSRAVVTNPAYQQLKQNLNEVESKLAILRTRQEEYRRRVQALQQQRGTLPIIEAELQRLNRDYQINKERYDNLMTRREAMKMSGDIQDTDEEIKFKLIDIPRIMIEKTWLRRIILVTSVVATGLAGGLIIAVVLSQLRPVIYGQRALGDLTGFPVFGAISQRETSAQRLHNRLDVVGFVLLSLILLVTYGLVLFQQLSYSGFPGIWQMLGGVQ